MALIFKIYQFPDLMKIIGVIMTYNCAEFVQHAINQIPKKSKDLVYDLTEHLHAKSKKTFNTKRPPTGNKEYLKIRLRLSQLKNLEPST